MCTCNTISERWQIKLASGMKLTKTFKVKKDGTGPSGEAQAAAFAKRHPKATYTKLGK